MTNLRFGLTEYGSPTDLANRISVTCNIDLRSSQEILLRAGSRVASSLGFSTNPITLDFSGTRAVDFAGIIRVSPSIELEVAPKFLGTSDGSTPWREDFFFLATISRHGRLLAGEHLSASSRAARDLPTLVARSLAAMYEARKRRPLRSYRRARVTDVFPDGDVDPVDLAQPTVEGFTQDVVRFDRENGWNADIRAAALALLPEVSEPSTVSKLVRLAEELSPQKPALGRRRPIPARHRAWTPLHELARDVLSGFGVSLSSGNAEAPGFVVSTWRLWEDLVTLGTRLGFGRSNVESQRGYILGEKVKAASGSSRDLSVFPDCVVMSDGARPSIVVDAKYKGRVERGNLRISESDVYESLAFARATGSACIALVYPASRDTPQQAPGTCTLFEEVHVGATRIYGIQAECRTVSRAGALRAFAKNLVSGVSEIAK